MREKEKKFKRNPLEFVEVNRVRTKLLIVNLTKKSGRESQHMLNRKCRRHNKERKREIRGCKSQKTPL